MRLSEAPLATPLVLTTLGIGDPLRMRELGLRIGAVLEVVQRAGFGGRVLTIGPTRIALDHVTCAALDVTPLAQTTASAS